MQLHRRLLRLHLRHGAGHGALRCGHRPKPGQPHHRRHEWQLDLRRHRHLRLLLKHPLQRRKRTGGELDLRQLGRCEHQIPEDGLDPALRGLGSRLRAGQRRQILCMRRRGRRRERLRLRPRHRRSGAVGFRDRRNLRRLRSQRLRRRSPRLHGQRGGRRSWCAGLLPSGAAGSRLQDQLRLVRQRRGQQRGALPMRHLLQLRCGITVHLHWRLLRLHLRHGAGHGALRRGHRPKPGHAHHRRYEQCNYQRRRRNLRAVLNRPLRRRKRTGGELDLRQLGRCEHQIPEDGLDPALRGLGSRLRAGQRRQILCMRRRGRRRERLRLRPRHRRSGAVGFRDRRNLRRLRGQRLRRRSPRLHGRAGRRSGRRRVRSVRGRAVHIV